MEFNQALIEAVRGLPTPLLLIDRRIIREKYAQVTHTHPGVEVFYAIKANPEPEVARILNGLGCGFEVSSTAELELALAAGAPAERIISGNPVKTPEFLRRAGEAGVRRFAYDSSEELRKVARWAPSSDLYLRLVVDNSGSEWPLSRKYGVEPAEALALIAEARDLGLRTVGLTFHVGSQCLRADSWVRALATCREVFQAAAGLGVELTALNLGGGLAVPHLKPIPEIAEIGQRILGYVREAFPPSVRLSVEPGRVLVGEAATLVTSVIGKAGRGDERWLYLDAGVFNALMETTGGIGYELRTEVAGELLPWTVAGPSCDSVDTLFSGALLPDLSVGQRVYIMNAGAYTLSYASTFNGFPPPAVAYVGES